MTDLINSTVSSLLRTPFGAFRLYANRKDDQPFRLIGFGQWAEHKSPLLRVQSACMASEVLFSQDCDCNEQLRLAFRMIAGQGYGLVIHLDQEGRGQGMEAKIKACQLMDSEGLDTVQAFDRLGLQQDVRDYTSVGAILREIGVPSVSLLTNNPRKVEGVSAAGVRVDRVVADRR